MMSRLFVWIAVVGFLAAAPGLASPPTETAEVEVPVADGEVLLCPAVEPAETRVDIDLGIETLLLPSPEPLSCPHGRPCPGGFCPDYPNCAPPVCEEGVCLYW
jgi:hypothetical protein